jgi:heme/copper-type cytochrome/quinol oxidase subunit 4
MINKNEKKASYVIISEILFALLPIIVIISILITTSENVLEIFTSADLSFVSVFFFGQTIVKLFSGISKSQTRKNWQIIILFVTVIIIIGLIPSIIWLCIIYLEVYKNKIIYGTQIFWFGLSLFVYFNIGKVGQMYLDEENK